MSLVDLWKKFFFTIQEREGDDTAEYVLSLARETTSKDQRTFPGPLIYKSNLRKIISRGILISLPGHRLAFRHEQLQDFLCAYGLFPDRPSVARIAQEFGNKPSKNILFWLHSLYHSESPGEEANFVKDILASEKFLPFFTRIIVLENLKGQINPTDNTANELSIYLSKWNYDRYFFEGLNNPAWIQPLYIAGYFYQPPAPIEVQPNSFQLPLWPAGEYIVRFAKDNESIILDMVRSINSENLRVQELLIDALIKITPEHAASVVQLIDPWLDGRFSGMLPAKLRELADHFLEAGYPQACLQILASVITPVLPDGSSKISQYSSPLKTRSDAYWVNEFVEKLAPKLNKVAPAGMVEVFSRQLLKAVELTVQVQGEDAELWLGYIWRLDIPNRESERGNDQVLDILIDGLRDSLVALCSNSPEQGYSTLKLYVDSEHLIFQRLALYTLRTFGHVYSDLLEEALLQRNYLEESKYLTEYRGLLRDQFGGVSEGLRSQVIAWILSGPLDIETRAQNHAKRQNRDATGEDRQEVQEYWTLYNLEIIRAYLSEAALDRLNALTAKHGTPDIKERPRIVTTSWGGPPSPVPASELAQKSFDELQQIFLSYVPEDLFHNPRESLAKTLQTIAREDPVKYSEFAEKLIHPGMRYVYLYHFLSGIREGLNNTAVKLTEPVVRLCEYVANLKEDPFKDSSRRYESDLFETQLETVQLLEWGLQSKDSYLSRELLDRIRAVLIILCHHPNPTPEQDAESSSFDPFTHSWNCVRGVAMHAILQYSLHVVRQYAKVKDTELRQGFLEPEIEALFEEKLNKTSDPSMAVHSVFGAFFSKLHFLSKDWAVKHLADIFPDDEALFRYWQAAWEAYVIASRVYGDVFNLLISQYQRGIRLLNQPKSEEKRTVRSSAESLAQHILSAYIAGFTDFGHENRLLDLFFENAPDEVRARGVFWLSQGLEAEKPKATDDTWKKLWALWENRLNAAESQDPQQNAQEISEYMRWVKNAPVGFEALYPVLRRSTRYFVIGFDIRLVVEFAAKHCREYPLEAVTLLNDCLRNAREEWWGPDQKDEQTTLQTAMESEIPEAREIAEEIINYHGERGDFRWKDLLT